MAWGPVAHRILPDATLRLAWQLFAVFGVEPSMPGTEVHTCTVLTVALGTSFAGRS